MQFIKGGNSKQSAVKDSTSRGRMDPGEVTLLLVFIKDWCLRDETRVTPDLHVDTSLTHVDDIPTTDTTPRASSPIVVDSFPSSPPEPPPSSLPPSRIEVRLIRFTCQLDSELCFSSVKILSCRISLIPGYVLLVLISMF